MRLSSFARNLQSDGSDSTRECKLIFGDRHENMRMRPPPRWANWLRGVRTRSLRAGLVGGPRPFSCCVNRRSASRLVFSRKKATDPIPKQDDNRESGIEICILESLSSSRSSKPTFVQACHLKRTSLKTRSPVQPNYRF